MQHTLAKPPYLKVRAIAKAPWFEIQLFRTHLRYRNPKASHNVTKNALGQKVDLRPFLNTALKAEYDCNENLGRCVVDIYHNAWSLYPRRFFSRPFASLSLSLRGVGVTRNDRAIYRDLYNRETAQIWLNNYYSSNAYGDAELPSLVNTATVQGQNDHTKSRLTVLESFRHKAYLVTPCAGTYDYFFPFTQADMLQFSFTVDYKAPSAAQYSTEINAVAAEFIDSMLRSVSLETKEPS